jgi:hypothetical protein
MPFDSFMHSGFQIGFHKLLLRVTNFSFSGIGTSLLLRSSAALLRHHFVASPQRVPVYGYRQGGRPVVNVIDRVPPRAIGWENTGESRSAPAATGDAARRLRCDGTAVRTEAEPKFEFTSVCV